MIVFGKRLMGRHMLRTVRALSCKAPVYVFKLGTCAHQIRACSGWEGGAVRRRAEAHLPTVSPKTVCEPMAIMQAAKQR